jgi:hypothetical protein
MTIKFFVFIAFLLVLNIYAVSAINTVESGFSMNGGQTRTIDAHGTCKIVENQVARKVFVPTKTLAEWESFRSNKPYGIVLSSCPYCGDGTCDTGECDSGCSQDCTWSDCCGDGVCQVNIEDAYTCPGDCGGGQAPDPGGGGSGGGDDDGGDTTPTYDWMTGTWQEGYGGDSGSKVICTEAHRLGYISDEFYDADKAYAETYANNAIMLGYHSWAKPVVRIMKKNSDFSEKVIPFAIAWSEHSAYKMGVKNEDNWAGKVILETSIPLCEELGEKMLKDGNENYEFDEEFIEGLAVKYLEDSDEMGEEQLKENITDFFSELKSEYLKDGNFYKEGLLIL